MTKDFPDNSKGEVTPEVSRQQNFWKWLAKYSLFVVLGIATLSVTVLHFKGRQLLDQMQRTPIPSFFLQDTLIPKALPDKIQVYQQALNTEKKQAWKKQSLQRKSSQSLNTAGFDSIEEMMHNQDTSNQELENNVMPTTKTQQKRRHNSRIAGNNKKKDLAAGQPNLSQNFFQPVKDTVIKTEEQQIEHFISCKVHGNQEIKNNTRLILRSQQAFSLHGEVIPAHTLLYGQVKVAQNKVYINISRILQFPVHFQVHDATYQSGLQLDENQSALRQATQQTAYRQGYRSLSEVPVKAAAELGRQVLQQAKRKEASIFLPDGYPLFIVNQN